MRDEILDIDWARLRHAYGPATDTPGHLAALRGDDQDAIYAAIEHLDTAVLHQGFAHSATAPAARIVADLIDRSAVDPGVRDILLQYLGWVAEAAVDAERQETFRPHLPALHAALAETYRTVWRFVDAENPDVRALATRAAVWHVRTAPLAVHRPDVVALLRRREADGEHRAWHVRFLVDLGEDVSGYLADADADVRTTAALAPAMAGRDDATAILIDALAAAAVTRPSTVAGWHGYTLADLVRAGVARVPDFARIAVPAAEIVRTASWTEFDRTWGLLVLAAFADRYHPRRPLTHGQRLIVGALVDNPQLWEPRNGSVGLVFTTAGLPHDRAACRRIYDG